MACDEVSITAYSHPAARASRSQLQRKNGEGVVIFILLSSVFPSIEIFTVENMATFFPAFWSHLAIRLVVVVFHLVPVTPITIISRAGFPENQNAITPRI